MIENPNIWHSNLPNISVVTVEVTVEETVEVAVELCEELCVLDKVLV